MDKYHTVIMIFLIGGMGIGITTSPPNLVMFYTMLAGVIGIILYGALKTRRGIQRQKRRDADKRHRRGTSSAGADDANDGKDGY